MNALLLIGIGILAGGLGMWCLMRIQKAFDDQNRRIDQLEAQVRGKQLPFHVRDGLENIQALKNYDAFDLARVRLYLEEAIKSVDAAASRQKKMGNIYDGLRNGRKE